MDSGIAWWSIAALVMHRPAIELGNERVRGRKRRPRVKVLIIVAACGVGVSDW